MDENEYNFDFVGNESWMLLALLTVVASMNNPEPLSDIPPCCTPYPIGDGRSFMQADKISIDEFTIEQMRTAAMNKKETNKRMLDSLYGSRAHKENDEGIKEDEPDGYRGLYGRSWDI